MSPLRLALGRWWPAALWMALIFVGSTDLLADSRTAGLLRPLLQALFPFLDEPGLELVHFTLRKLGHVTEYAILAALLWRGWIGRRDRIGAARFGAAALLIIAICVAYAASDEWHQSFTAARHGAWQDVAIDGCGALLGLGWCAWRFRRRERSEATPQRH